MFVQQTPNRTRKHFLTGHESITNTARTRLKQATPRHQQRNQQKRASTAGVGIFFSIIFRQSQPGVSQKHVISNWKCDNLRGQNDSRR